MKYSPNDKTRRLNIKFQIFTMQKFGVLSLALKK